MQKISVVRVSTIHGPRLQLKVAFEGGFLYVQVHTCQTCSDLRWAQGAEELEELGDVIPSNDFIAKLLRCVGDSQEGRGLSELVAEGAQLLLPYQ